MQCPSCDVYIEREYRVCPNCGIALSLFKRLVEMRNDLKRVKHESENIPGQLNLLQQKLSNFESEYIEGLHRSQKVKIEPKAKSEITSEKVSDDVQNSVKAGPVSNVSKDKSTLSLSMTNETLGTASKRTASSKAPGQSSTFRPGAEVRFGQKWLLIIGIIIMVLGIGLFLKYAFDNNWIGPAGRTAMAFLTGIIFLVLGEFFRRKALGAFGLYLIGGGIATLYFSTFAAFQIYNLIGQVTAFGIMILITVLVALLSLIYNTKWLVVLGILGGFMTPVILSTVENNQIVLMTYMVILNCGILAIAFFKQWHLLNYIGAACTWILFSGWFMSAYTDAAFWQTTIFLNIFFLIFTFAPFVYYFVNEHQNPISGFAITMPNVFIAFGYSFSMISDHFSVNHVSIVALSYAAIFILMANFLYRKNRDALQPFVLLLSKGILFLVITVPLIFSNHWITVFWMAQAVALLWASIRLRNVWFCGGALVLLSLTTTKFFGNDYTQVFHLEVNGLSFNYRNGFTAILLERMTTTISILGAFWFSGRILASEGNKFVIETKYLSVILYSFFGGILFVVLNIEVAAFFHDYADMARLASISVLWTLFSIALMVLGFIRNRHTLRMISISLFGITIFKVFVMDMKNVGTPFRIISFLVLGLVLIGASYLYYRYRDRIVPMENNFATSEGSLT
ncbi:MAG: DUF2339 domain-containing protein [Candidatus Scalindua sp.]|nr:DUF2339 domain-containing protein [Candidatus Scalindua sp.]